MTDSLTHANHAELKNALSQREDVELRTRAACALGDQLRFGETTLSDDLRSLLVAAADEPGDLGFEAGIALCEARDPAGKALIRVLGDKYRRFDAVKALSRLRDDDVKTALHHLSQRFLIPWPDKLAASAACAVLGDAEGARYFEAALTSRWFNARRAMAVHLLGDLRHPEAYTMLMALAERPGDPWRPVAIRALGHLGDKRAVPALRAFGSDVEEDVKYALDLLT